MRDAEWAKRQKARCEVLVEEALRCREHAADFASGGDPEDRWCGLVFELIAEVLDRYATVLDKDAPHA